MNIPEPFAPQVAEFPEILQLLIAAELAALDTPQTRAALERAFPGADHATKLAMIHHAPDLFGESQRIAVLVATLEHGEIYGGLTQALLMIETYHPPQIIDALLRCVLQRDGATAGRFAAMLLFLHGKAESSFDWAHRPFFLSFQEGDRRELFRELCDRIGLDEAARRRLEKANP